MTIKKQTIFDVTNHLSSIRGDMPMSKQRIGYDESCLCWILIIYIVHFFWVIGDVDWVEKTSCCLLARYGLISFSFCFDMLKPTWWFDTYPTKLWTYLAIIEGWISSVVRSSEFCWVYPITILLVAMYFSCWTRHMTSFSSLRAPRELASKLAPAMFAT